MKIYRRNQTKTVTFGRRVHIAAKDVSTELALKIYSLCDLACPNCYMFEDGKPLRPRPRKMSNEVIVQTALRLRDYMNEHKLGVMKIVLHGGEPLLAGIETIRFIVTTFRTTVSKKCQLDFSIQTNGTQLNEAFLEMALELGGVVFGISLDGDEQGNTNRPYHDGRSSYPRVRQALELFDDSRYKPLLAGLLCVVDPTHDPDATMRELMKYDVPIDFLLPISSWRQDTEPKERPTAGPTPYADWIIRACLYRTKHRNGPSKSGVRIVEQLLYLIHLKEIGKEVPWDKMVEFLGPYTVGAFFVETDGKFEMLDGLNKVKLGESDTGLDVWDNSLTQALVVMLETAEARGIIEASPICQNCPKFDICGGGHYLERRGPENGYRNPSVYCEDLQKLIEILTLLYRWKQAQVSR